MRDVPQLIGAGTSHHRRLFVHVTARRSALNVFLDPECSPTIFGFACQADPIAQAVAEPDGEVHCLGTIANREDSDRKFIKKLGKPEQLRACYEAGPTGFALYWQMGFECAVMAPSLVAKSSEIA